MSNKTQQDHARRFNGVARLYGSDGLARFDKAHIIVIGIGGVGSWVVEALARNAIGKLTLIDMDVVAESNINRQLPALTSTLGRNKIDVMKQRVQDINDQCEVITIDDFIDQDNLQDLILGNAKNAPDHVVDCIDNSRVKAALIAWCKRRKIPIISMGGAGGQINPELIKTADLSRTIHDPLLSKTRKILRQKYGFSSNTKRRFGVPCVYSTEHMSLPNDILKNTQLDGLRCAGGIGSSVNVTATFGFMAAAFVLRNL
jgi:tRNA A37 threonylcarbamoyladenosine dehydratase